MESKTCTKCDRMLTTDSFHRDPTHSDGLCSRCKSCIAKAAKIRRAKYHKIYRELETQRDRKRWSNPEYRAKAYATKDPTKESARTKLRYAVYSGKIIKPTSCQKCGGTRRLDGHHADYSKPLDVEWLCTKCHTAAHNLQPSRGE